MIKRLLALTLALVMLLGVSAQAAEPSRSPVAAPSLVFSGTTATCSVTIRSGKPTDQIAATAKLWNGGTCLRTWRKSGTLQVYLTGTATVSRNKTYRLTVDYTVNGIAQPQKSVTRTYPQQLNVNKGGHHEKTYDFVGPGYLPFHLACNTRWSK